MEAIPERRKLGELAGELVTWKVARERAKRTHRIAMVEFEDGYALDATDDTLMRFVNHSCESNCFIRRSGHRVEFYSRRALVNGEELTADYGETHHEGTHPCGCGAAKCRKFL